MCSLLLSPYRFLLSQNPDCKFTPKTWLNWFWIPNPSLAPPAPLTTTRPLCTRRWKKIPKPLRISKTALFVIRKRDFNFTLLSAQTQCHRFKTFTVNSAVSGETHSRWQHWSARYKGSQRDPEGNQSPETHLLFLARSGERDRQHVFCIGWVFAACSHARKCTALFMAAVIELTDVIFLCARMKQQAMQRVKQ